VVNPAKQDKVVVTLRRMTGSGAKNRIFHRPDCPTLKTRPTRRKFSQHLIRTFPHLDDQTMTREKAVAYRYRPCQRCNP
jgi:hypothetical protein